MPYIPGQFWRICDRCGMRYRKGDTLRTWDNLWVCEECFETRQPQDFVKGKADRQAVRDPRPDVDPYFLADNEVTAGDL